MLKNNLSTPPWLEVQIGSFIHLDEYIMWFIHGNESDVTLQQVLREITHNPEQINKE